MSELEATTPKALVMAGRHNEPIYLKSEADKVIALLSDKANYNEYAYKNKKQELVDTCQFFEEELRHQKYKRCLAMAEKCESMCYWFSARFDHHELVDNVKWELFDRWRLRWAKLADKFKEAK